jgi:ketosteroid isomerase-like protein
MSQENVEIVQAGFEAWNAGDMDALRELYDPDAISRAPEGWPEPGASVGRNAIMRQFGQLRETWDADAFEVIGAYIEVGDRVAVRCIWRGAGHGPELSLQMTCVFTVRNGRIFGVEFFWHHAEGSKPWRCRSRRCRRRDHDDTSSHATHEMAIEGRVRAHF